jgi:hypothetical protein
LASDAKLRDLSVKVFACCARAFEEATRRAAGVEPLTSPPLTREDAEVLLRWMAWAEFVYVDLHGAAGGTCWLGDGHVAAVAASQLAAGPRLAAATQLRAVSPHDGETAGREGWLGGTVVFAANCHLGDRDSPMMDALLDAGARYVVAGEGPNAGPKAGRLYGAPLLGLWFRRLVGVGVGPLRALGWAKQVVRVDEVLVGGEVAAANVDAVGFRVYVRTGRA